MDESSVTVYITSAKIPIMNSAQPIRVNALHGHVKHEIYGKGTKSERKAIMIKTSDANYILRRKIGPAFYDAELIQYIEHDVECEGFLVGNTLLAEKIKIVD